MLSSFRCYKISESSVTNNIHIFNIQIYKYNRQSDPDMNILYPHSLNKTLVHTRNADANSAADMDGNGTGYC